ncbi:MAG: ACT domain-containing protein [Acidobacteriales bacterium]|nr:MAG: ACT domain-containing protein [Terriglobales bacterium]
MKIHQLSLFLENKPGRLIEPCRLLADAGINVRTLSVADTQQFGILRMIVSDWQKAMALLTGAGCVVKVTEVLAVEVPDRPGGLAGVLELFENSGVNIEYMYAFTFGRQDRAVLIFRFDKPDEAIERLQAAGMNVVESVDVYSGGSAS